MQRDPFVSCARCVKQNLRCVIEPNFKRVGKRNRNAEMEKEMEIEEDRKRKRGGERADKKEGVEWMSRNESNACLHYIY